MDLRGALVEWASKEKSSKKHVIEVRQLLCWLSPRSTESIDLWLSPRLQLKTRQGTELLIQSEIDSVINDWYRALTEAVSTHVSGRLWSLLFKTSCWVWRPMDPRKSFN